MKSILLLSITLLSAATLFAQSSGGPFALTSSVLAGSGGTSTGGVFAISGTLGQPLVGGAGGGSYGVQSGFWGTLQTPGAPALRITRTGTNAAVVAWPAPSTGWVLQQTTALKTPPELTAWTDVTSPPIIVVGSDNTVTFSPATGNRYFRLKRP